MVHATILAERTNGDMDRLMSPLFPLIKYTSQAVQMQLSNMLNNGVRFGLKSYLAATLQQPLATAMLANHLAGIRRTDLTFKQSAPKTEKAKLELSFFSGVMQYFRNRDKIDINALKKKYNTTAFEVISNFADNIKKELSDATEQLIKEGAHVREAKKVLAIKFAEFGIRPASRSQIETIFRTQAQIAFAAGKYNAEQDETIYDALWGYKYVTIGDDRVRPTHAILDGITLPKAHKFWEQFYPPNGWNCRCQAIPIFEKVDIVKPILKLPDGTKVKPDKGFDWHSGKVFNALGA